MKEKNIMASLNAYSGTWGRKQVVHLLKRTMFGAKPSDIDYFLSKNLQNSVDELLTLGSTPPSQPLNYYEGFDLGGGQFMKDADNIAKGQTWVNATYGDGTTNFFRGESIKGWWIGNLLNQARSIEEKLIVFWSNHFVTELKAGGGATGAYRLIELFRTYAYSPLSTLMVEVSKNTQMCHYLNVYLNTKYSPDENYARELQELFGVGKGPDSKYTESDVKEAARVLTGLSIDWQAQTFLYRTDLHDSDNKQFSSFYGNKVIIGKSGTNGLQELTELVDMILETDECAKFIIRKIYRFFVNYDISTEIENDIITPLANIYRSNGYNLKPALDKLFKSEHFFDTNIISAYIKTPLDLMIGFCRESGVQQPPVSPLENLYKFWIDIYNVAGIQNQFLGNPPNVAGWPAFYQSPLFYDTWINSDTYPKRVNYPLYFLYGGFNNSFDHIRFASAYPNISDPVLFVKDLCQSIYTMDVSQASQDAIRVQILQGGLSSTSYWTLAWNDYIADPNNSTKKSVVVNRLTQLLAYLIQSPHYQLC